MSLPYSRFIVITRRKLRIVYALHHVIYLCIRLSHHDVIPNCLMHVIREQWNVLLTDYGSKTHTACMCPQLGEDGQQSAVNETAFSYLEFGAHTFRLIKLQ